MSSRRRPSTALPATRHRRGTADLIVLRPPHPRVRRAIPLRCTKTTPTASHRRMALVHRAPIGRRSPPKTHSATRQVRANNPSVPPTKLACPRPFAWPGPVFVARRLESSRSVAPTQTVHGIPMPRSSTRMDRRACAGIAASPDPKRLLQATKVPCRSRPRRLSTSACSPSASLPVAPARDALRESCAFPLACVSVGRDPRRRNLTSRRSWEAASTVPVVPKAASAHGASAASIRRRCGQPATANASHRNRNRRSGCRGRSGQDLVDRFSEAQAGEDAPDARLPMSKASRCFGSQASAYFWGGARLSDARAGRGRGERNGAAGERSASLCRRVAWQRRRLSGGFSTLDSVDPFGLHTGLALQVTRAMALTHPVWRPRSVPAGDPDTSPWSARPPEPTRNALPPAGDQPAPGSAPKPARVARG